MFLIEKLNIQKKLNKGRRVLFCSLLLGLALSLTSCNLGKTRDENVLSTPNYRKVNTACAGMDLSKSTIDVKTFRAIVSCFNAYGALDPVQALFKSLSDSDLLPLVDAVNKYILQSPETLYKLKESYGSLKKHGYLDQTLEHVGSLLRKDLVTSSLALMKDGYTSTSSSSMRRSGQVPADQDLLKAVEVLGSKMTPALIEEILSFGLNISTAKSFHDFQKLMSVPASSKTYNLIQVTTGVHNFLQDTHTYACDAAHPQFEMRNDFIAAVISGDAFTLVDDVLGKTVPEIQTQVARLDYVLGKLLMQPAQASSGSKLLMERMISAVQTFNKPIDCLSGSQQVANGARHLLRRLAALPQAADSTDYILAGGVRELFLLKPVCELPVGTNDDYRAMIEVARAGAMPGLVDVIRALDHIEKPWKGCDGQAAAQGTYRPLTSLFVNLLGDQGASGGLKQLVPLLSSITEDDVWPELLLLASLPGDHDRDNSRAALQFLVEPRAQELSGKSVFEILSKVVSKASYKHLFDFILAVRSFMEDPVFKNNPALLEEILQNLRNGLLVNNVNPVVDLLRDVMKDASQNDALFDTIFKISDQPEFADSVELFATMAKDGRLKELMDAANLLFQKFADQAKNQVFVQDLTVQPFQADRRHDLQRINLVNPGFKEIQPGASATIDSCAGLNLDFSIAETADPQFEAQMKLFQGCLGEGDGIATALSFLNEQKTSDGRESYFKLLVKMAKQTVSNAQDPIATFDKNDMGYFVGRWMASYDDGSLFRWMNAVPYWVGHAPDLNSATTLVSPVFKIAQAIMNDRDPETDARDSVRELDHFVADVLRRPDFPALLADLEDLKKKTEPPLPLDPSPLDCRHYPTDQERVSIQDSRKDWAHLPPRSLTESWVRIKECDAIEKFTNPAERDLYVNQRVDEIYRETCEARTNWELVTEAGVKQRRTQWHTEDLQKLPNAQGALFERLDPMLAAFTDPSRSIPKHWIGDEQLAFMKEKTPEELLGFLYPRSLDYRLITLVFPGEQYPRVVLVNTLDLLEIVLQSTDMVSKLPSLLEATLGKLLPKKNLGLDFLLEIAYAWGDLPSDQWPTDIPKQWLVHGRPRTLLEAVKDITHRGNPTENLSALSFVVVGLTKVPACNKNKAFPDPQSRWGVGAIFTGELGDDFRRRLYNIWQVAIVLEENAPGSNIGYNGGLEVLRDLFYHVVQSTPEKYRYAEPKDHEYEKNNLSVILRSVRMGAFRQIGRVLREFRPQSMVSHLLLQQSLEYETETLLNNVPVRHFPDWSAYSKNVFPADPVLKDFFTTLLRMAHAPQAGSTLKSFLAVEDRQFFWVLMKELFETLDVSPESAKNLKKTLYYAFADLNRFQSWPIGAGGVNASSEVGEPDLMALLTHQLGSVISIDGPYLSRHPEIIETLLRAKGTDKVAQNFYGVQWERNARKRVLDLLSQVLSDYPVGTSPVLNGVQLIKAVQGKPAAKAAWDQLKPLYDQLQLDPSYTALDLGKLVDDLLLFLEQKGEYNTPEARAASEKLRRYLAFQLESGNGMQFLDLIKNKPDETYQLVRTLSDAMGSGQQGRLKEFFAMIKAGLSGSQH